MKSDLIVVCVPETQIVPDWERKIVALQKAAFPTARQFAHQRWISCRPAETDMWFLVMCAGALVASAWLHRRAIETTIGFLNIGGVANVCSHPDIRGKGAAKRCMFEVQRYLSGSDCNDYGLLFCGDKVAGFYRTLGWQAVRNSRRLTNSSGQPAVDDECVRMIYPGNRDVASWPNGEIDLCGPEW